MGFNCGIVGLPNVGRVAVPDARLRGHDSVVWDDREIKNPPLM